MYVSCLQGENPHLLSACLFLERSLISEVRIQFAVCASDCFNVAGEDLRAPAAEGGASHTHTDQFRHEQLMLKYWRKSFRTTC